MSPCERKKILLEKGSARAGETKSPKLAPKMLPGWVAIKRVRCGKPNCKCAQGERHTAFYHVMVSDGQRTRQYVRKADVKAVRAACESHRKLHRELLAGRLQHQHFMQLAKAMFRDLAGS
jgi:hypothetical protein